MMAQIGSLARGLALREVPRPVGVSGPAVVFSPSLAVVLPGQDYVAAVSERRETDRKCVALRIAVARTNAPARVSSRQKGNYESRRVRIFSTAFCFLRGNLSKHGGMP